MGESVSAEILERLGQGKLILTNSDRAACVVRLAWNRLQFSRGRQSWEPANTLSWRSWTSLLWRKILLDDRSDLLLLSPSQEELVWRRVIEADSPVETLRSASSLAGQAAATWQLLCAYEGTERLGEALPQLTDDSLQFALWARSFNEICVRESLLSASSIEIELRRHLVRNHLKKWNQGFLLVGFDQTTPAQQSFINHCRYLGAALEFAQDSSPQSVVLVAASDENEELRGCARWIRNQLRKAPRTRVGLIVNDLVREMSSIDAVLREVLSPESEHIAANSSLAPYEFSLGTSLAHEPMVQCALDLLRWVSTPLALQRVSQLLLSPYFARVPQEADARAEFDYSDLKNRQRLKPEITIKSLLQELQIFSSANLRLPYLCRVIENIEYVQSHSDLRARGYGEWAEWVRAWLMRAEWAVAESSYSLREDQVREQWSEVLDTFASLDFSGGEIDFEEALVTLNRLVVDFLFLPQSKDASVQVLGPLDAAGEQFDAVWVLRAGELSWPTRSTFLPLLTRSLQRDLGMPNADSRREREAAEQLTRRLAGSSANVFFSYAQSIPDGGRQRAAAFIRDLNLRSAILSEVAGPEEPRSPIALERVRDESRISALSTATPRGGVRILELQAACAFRAFAEIRLGSSERNEREAGFNTLERGKIVHAALEVFWDKVGSQRNLITRGQSERDKMVHQAVSYSLAEAQRRCVDAWDVAYLRTQHVWLTRLLNDWLSVELERPDFLVLAQEKRQSVSIGSLQLTLRVDRVDSVDGRSVIIDYKTGPTNTSEWLSDRPDKPQVPLYAVFASDAASQLTSAPSRLGAVAFAQVRTGKSSMLRGFEAVPGMLFLPGSRSKPATMEAGSFEAQIVRWREILEKLANDFRDGDARVRPKRYPMTCKTCSQRLLCRVDASSFETRPEELPPEDESGLD